LGQAYLKSGEREKGQQELAEAGRLKALARKKQEDQLSGKLPASEGPGENP
jgi:hypothetical protein